MFTIFFMIHFAIYKWHGFIRSKAEQTLQKNMILFDIFFEICFSFNIMRPIPSPCFWSIYVQKSGRYFSIGNFSVKINSDLHSLVWVKCSCPHVPFQSRFDMHKQICYAKSYKHFQISKKYLVLKKVPSRGNPSVCPAEEIKLKDGQNMYLLFRNSL